MTTPNTAAFTVSYEGESVMDNTIDVRDLAPGMIALGEMFQRTNQLFNGEQVTVSLRVRASSPGSFDLSLELSLLFAAATQALSGQFVTSAANLKELLTGDGSVVGAIGLLKRLRGQQATTSPGPTPDALTIEIQGFRMVVPSSVYTLSQDVSIRRQMRSLVEPLRKIGIDRIVLRELNQELEVLEKDDADVLSAYPNIPAARKAMRAQAKWRKAR